MRARSSVGLEHLTTDQEVIGSNPFEPAIFHFQPFPIKFEMAFLFHPDPHFRARQSQFDSKKFKFFVSVSQPSKRAHLRPGFITSCSEKWSYERRASRQGPSSADFGRTIPGVP
jgi:hypothetical protein